MKTVKLYAMLLTAVVMGAACTPIEDESLREKYYENAGTPITKAELQAAISITQPIPNADGVVEGDQYVVVKNARPDVHGVWHYTTKLGEKLLNTDAETIIYEANGTYSIYFAGISANKIVQTDPVEVTVTNCFDDWETLLTGAKNKADKTAKKTWEFWPSATNDLVYFNGMYGNWLAADVYKIHEAGTNNWGGFTTLAKAGAYTLEFALDENKLTTYKPDGSVLGTGNYAYSHTPPQGPNGEQDVIVGTLTTTTALPGSETAWNFGGQTNTFWLWLIDEDHIAVILPTPIWAVGDFWDNDAWYGFYQAKK